MRKKFALTVAYDGTRYAGWQIQPNGVAIQHVVSKAVSRVVGREVIVHGSGRTDAGVHAVGQVASFTMDSWRHSMIRLAQAINGHLPRDISALECRPVVEDFDPIRDAIAKRYRYSIRSSRVPDPIGQPHHWWLPKELDLDLMRAGAERLVGTRDFKAFEALGSTRKTSVRTVRELVVSQRAALAGSTIEVEIEADGFLYNMVRNIVGALVEIGKGRFPPHWLDEVLESRTRDSVSQTAPARGLCLVRVDYPEEVFLSL
jgi:tRNA pseudouridine38-40 synthase